MTCRTFAAAGCVWLAATTGVSAGEEPVVTQLPTRACEPARAMYDTHLRKSPMGMVNEGDAVAFVTCGLPTNTGSPPSLFRTDIVLQNQNHAAVAVTCTLVDPGQLFDTPLYVPRSRTLSAGTIGESMFWVDFVEGQEGFWNASISCALPPGTGITLLVSYQKADWPMTGSLPDTRPPTLATSQHVRGAQR